MATEAPTLAIKIMQIIQNEVRCDAGSAVVTNETINRIMRLIRGSK